MEINSNLKLIILFFSLVFCNQLWSQIWKQEKKIVSPDRNEYEYFGATSAADGNWYIAGSIGEDHDSLGLDSIINCGAAYLYERNNKGQWIFKQKINSSNREMGESFGWSVSIHGNYLLCSAISNKTNALNMDTLSAAGAVFVFKKSVNNKWVEEAKLIPSDRESSDNFGWSTDIYDNWAVIGVRKKRNDTIDGIPGEVGGAAYVFKRLSNGTWKQMQKLIPSDRNIGDLFGTSVKIQGNYIVVGSPGHDMDVNDNNFIENSGAAYLFEKESNDNWIEVQKLVANDRSLNATLGYTVSIDDINIVCSAHFDSFDSDGKNKIDSAGAIYLFKHEINAWKQIKKIVAPDRGRNDRFGASIDIKNDLIVCSSPFDSDALSGLPSKKYSGSLYVYNFKNSDWLLSQKIKTNHPKENDGLGTNVSICDTNNVFVASYNNLDEKNLNPIIGAGSSYLFVKDNFVGVIEEGLNEANVYMYPNPTEELCNIQLQNVIKNVSIIQYDLGGRIVQRLEFENKKNISFKLVGEEGMYLVKFLFDNQEITKKVIKK